MNDNTNATSYEEDDDDEKELQCNYDDVNSANFEIIPNLD
ncbi:hypothetical protein T4E_12341 [Trichinella pseudospiralis]|uniref:Uncharacterized protein n=1 Tax=Trichinella pseudospiralis TaxID=6337 RepID=A0A0V0X7Z9_TRIPS|nr:hypothetical protein T4E_12341 [Trichinella pseudospiralis]